MIGIDVSKYQKNIKWESVKKYGVEFAIIKATQKANDIEPMFESHYKGATSNGIKVGVYRYVYAKTVSEAKAEAQAVLNAIKGKTLEWGIWLDMEDASIRGLGKSKLNEIIEEQANIFIQGGYNVGIYCNEDWYKNVLDGKSLASKYPMWVARYGQNDGTKDDKYKPNVDNMSMWQYTSKGNVVGIDGNVDVNYCYFVPFKEKVQPQEQENKNTMKIGHASIDERNSTKGGQAGDQTGKEVCIRDWYNRGWSVMLRPISSEVAEKSAIACEKGCANNNIGYDQNQRNTLRTQASKVGFDLSKITTPCETDCSAFMSVCAESAGVNIPYTSGNAPTTANMRSKFTSTRQYEAHTETKYLTSDKYLKRGDILVKEGFHTVMVLGNGTDSITPSQTEAQPTADYSKTQFIKDVQSAIGASVDGIAGKETLGKTITVSATSNNKHKVVKPLQKYLNYLGYNCGTVDGIAGSKFTSAVKSYQKNVVKASAKNQDGIITKSGATWKKLLGLA